MFPPRRSTQQIATKAASEQSNPKREKRPRKLDEVTKRTSALGMSELTYSFNCEDAAGQCSARKSKVFALARNSARSFSAEILRAASRHFFARRRYSSGLLMFLYAIEFYWFL
jgi:hypothetical protein